MLLAVDTNVLARALVNDGSAQTTVARKLFLEHMVFVADSVLLETEWVLRSHLKLGRSAVSDLFLSLLSAEKVSFEDRPRISRVVLAHRDGLDFADGMHLFAAEGCEAMITFDEAFVRRSRKIDAGVEVRKP